MLSRRQLFAAVVHLGFLDLTDPVEMLFDGTAADVGQYTLNELVIDSFQGDWIEFAAGGTETGVIFEAGTMTMIAEVSDGDLRGCVEQGAQ